MVAVIAEPPVQASPHGHRARPATRPGARPGARPADRRPDGAVARTETLAPYVARPGAAGPSRLTYWRRRAVVLAVAVALVALVAPRFRAALGGAPASAPEGGPVPRTYVVEPGDTVWTIARRLHPTGDPRGVVAAIEARHGTGALRVGETLVLAG